MIRKYIIVADDSVKGFDEGIAKLEREWGAEELEPCEDVISRQAVLDKFAEVSNVSKRPYHDMWEYVKNMPSVMWSTWTPATQLPPSHEAVLLYVKYKSSGQWTYLLGMWNDNKKAWEDWLTPYRLEDDFEIIEWTDVPDRRHEENVSAE